MGESIVCRAIHVAYNHNVHTVLMPWHHHCTCKACTRKVCLSVIFVQVYAYTRQVGQIEIDPQVGWHIGVRLHVQ